MRLGSAPPGPSPPLPASADKINLNPLIHSGSSTEEMTIKSCVAGVTNLQVYLDGGELKGRVI